MKQLIRVTFCLFLMMLMLCCSKAEKKEAVVMNVYFESCNPVTDKETGDTIHCLDFELFSLPDTTLVESFYSVPGGLSTSTVETSAGTQYLVRVKTCEPLREWYVDHGFEDMLEGIEKYVREVQGQHEELWLGPFTVPDTANTPEGAVKFELPKITLSRAK